MMRMLLEYIVVAVALLCQVRLLINLGTLYFLCKRFNPSGRDFKAADAALKCCCNRTNRNVYPEATRPTWDVIVDIWSSEESIFHFSYWSIIKFIIRLVVGSLSVNTMYHWPNWSNETTLGICLIISCMLWFSIGGFIWLTTRNEDRQQHLDGFDPSDDVSELEFQVV
jgi:hypothetical protein